MCVDDHSRPAHRPVPGQCSGRGQRARPVAPKGAHGGATHSLLPQSWPALASTAPVPEGCAGRLQRTKKGRTCPDVFCEYSRVAVLFAKKSKHVRRRAAARGGSSLKSHAGCENMKRRFMFGRSFCPRRQGASAQKQHWQVLSPAWIEHRCGSQSEQRSSRSAPLGCPEARPPAGSQTRRIRSHASSR